MDLKDFKIKNGLIVEGSTGTINNYDILTKSSADQTYIIGLIGGAATPNNTPNTVVLRDGSGNFSAHSLSLHLKLILKLSFINNYNFFFSLR